MCFVDSASHLQGRYGVPYRAGSYTYCACIAKVAFLSIFIFFYNSHDLPQKTLHAFTAKKITQLDDFFARDLHFSLPIPSNPGPACLPVYLSVFVCLSVCLSVSVSLFVRLACLSVCLPPHPPVHRSAAVWMHECLLPCWV